MKGDAAASAVGFVAALGSTSAAWLDAFWAGLVAWVDAILKLTPLPRSSAQNVSRSPRSRKPK